MNRNRATQLRRATKVHGIAGDQTVGKPDLPPDRACEEARRVADVEARLDWTRVGDEVVRGSMDFSRRAAMVEPLSRRLTLVDGAHEDADGDRIG